MDLQVDWSRSRCQLFQDEVKRHEKAAGSEQGHDEDLAEGPAQRLAPAED